MKQIISLSIDVGKIDKALLYKAPKSGKTYLNLSVLIRDEEDKYGNDGMVVQNDPNPENKGPILGNCKIRFPKKDGNQQAQQQSKPQASSNSWDEPIDDIPF